MAAMSKHKCDWNCEVGRVRRTKAVIESRDAVVEAAKAWAEPGQTLQRIDDLRAAVNTLLADEQSLADWKEHANA